ncbi:MAG: hypothetical protein QE485_18465 [Acidovorax sp.]|uniref:hypothetical protein n=1 Tax=Acidovorax sp. TaxID=1872122 RepID=UPI002622117C|nr:hypothetical protein [Acidovorax sp.]MDH4419199.1 hypothetical protein [Acidovorax sp.]
MTPDQFSVEFLDAGGLVIGLLVILFFIVFGSLFVGSLIVQLLSYLQGLRK